MFLSLTTYFGSSGNTIHCMLSWIESHSVTVGVITAVIVSSLWMRKLLRQKRAEAFFGFYARLMLQLKSLRAWLQEKSMLEVKNENVKSGNIYALIYDPATLDEACPGFHTLTENQLDELRDLVSQLRKTLLESENNVYPKSSDRKSWYDSQHILFEFCDFIERDSMRGNTNKAKFDSGDNSGKYKHLVKCEELIVAMDSIQSSIENENY